MNINEDITEREQKLINHILFLISILNIYTVTIAYFYQSAGWLEGMLEKQNTKETQEEIVRYLEDEFGIKLETMTDREVIKNKADADRGSDD